MKKDIKLDFYSPEEEKANVLTHLIGVIGGFIGLAFTFLNVSFEQISTFWSCAIFFLSMILLYSASSVYHWVQSEKRKKLFKQLDHISIYVLIAGTFTPFAWSVLGNETLGQNMLISIWLIALAGILFKVFYTGRYEAISLISYLGMGWLGYLMFGRISEVLGSDAVDLMLYGGLSYTIGVVFYLMRKLKYHHAIWHVFVLSGTGFHAWAVVKYIIRI